MINYKNLTEFEIEALKQRYNLADAHTHMTQSLSQKKIIENLPNIWYEAENKKQEYFEEKFLNSFFQSQNQNSAFNLRRSYLNYSSSLSIMIISYFLAKNNYATLLIEPTFDNLPDLLKRAGVKVRPLREEVLLNNTFMDLKGRYSSDAIFLVDPNNPTGNILLSSEKSILDLLSYCKEENKILILDLCFAPFANLDPNVGRVDIYKHLEESGITYLVVEDTGKFLPTQDAKASILTVSKDIYDEVFEIQTEVLLNVSPFILNLLSYYLDDGFDCKFNNLRDLLETNKSYLINSLPKQLFEVRKSKCLVSVGWVKMLNQGMYGSFCDMLADNSIYVLPGSHFFWSSGKGVGNNFFRIAMARDKNYFQECINTLLTTLKEKGYE